MLKLFFVAIAHTLRKIPCLLSKGEWLHTQLLLPPGVLIIWASPSLWSALLHFWSLNSEFTGSIKLHVTVPDHLSTSHQFLLFLQVRHFNAASNETDFQCHLHRTLLATTCQCWVFWLVPDRHCMRGIMLCSSLRDGSYLQNPVTTESFISSESPE